MTNGRLTVVILTAACCAAPAAADGPMDVYALEAANRMGLLEHCLAQGFAIPKDVENARKVLMDRPALPSGTMLQSAEAEGKRGKLLAAGEYRTLEQLGDQSRMTVRQMCEGLAENASVAVGMLDGP